MVSETDVRMAYRLLMGREAENDRVVQDHARNLKTLDELRVEFMNSPEFHDKLKLPPQRTDVVGVKPLTWPPIQVEVEVNAETLQRMAQRIEGEFAALGESDPHWSVLTDEKFRAGNIKETESEFYATGQIVADDLAITAARCGLDLSRHKTCFELGCGVGRISIWLARLFPKLIGADISQRHLTLAKAAADRAGVANVELLHLNRMAAYQRLPAFDFFFSSIVLQHNPPPLMAFMLENILQRLAPGGHAYFQIPTYLKDYRFDTKTYLASKPVAGDVEVHCIPQPVLFAILRRTGCELLELREDSSLGYESVSNRVLVRKARQ